MPFAKRFAICLVCGIAVAPAVAKKPKPAQESRQYLYIDTCEKGQYVSSVRLPVEKADEVTRDQLTALNAEAPLGQRYINRTSLLALIHAFELRQELTGDDPYQSKDEKYQAMKPPQGDSSLRLVVNPNAGVSLCNKSRYDPDNGILRLKVRFDMANDRPMGFMTRLLIAERNTGSRSYEGQNGFGARRHVDELDTATTYLEFVNVKEGTALLDKISMDADTARQVVPHLGYQISFIPYLSPDDPKWVSNVEDYVTPTYSDPIGGKTAEKYLRAKLVRIDVIDRSTMKVYGQYVPENFQTPLLSIDGND